jgi:alpha-mannosidase
MARFGCPFGSIERPQLSGIEADEAMWEVPGSRWAAIQRDGGEAGLAICAESKLGYAARDGSLSITLLRSPKNPDETADMGTHSMPFAVGRYRKNCTEQDMSTVMAADHLFTPPLIAKTAPRNAPFTFENLASLSPSWTAPSETLNGYFVRLHETAGGQGTAKMHFETSPKSVQLVDFFEKTMQVLKVKKDHSVTIPYAPYKILTVLVER